MQRINDIIHSLRLRLESIWRVLTSRKYFVIIDEGENVTYFYGEFDTDGEIVDAVDTAREHFVQKSNEEYILEHYKKHLN